MQKQSLMQTQSTSNQYQASVSSNFQGAHQQVSPPGHDHQTNQSMQASGSQAFKGQNLNHSYFSQISSINGGGSAANGNLNHTPSVGLGSINIALSNSYMQGLPAAGGMPSQNNS